MIAHPEGRLLTGTASLPPLTSSLNRNLTCKQQLKTSIGASMCFESSAPAGAVSPDLQDVLICFYDTKSAALNHE